MARNAEYRLSTPKLVDKILTFCEAYSGYTLYPYQVQWGKRLIRSVLENDGAEITALFSRQCIPEGEYIHTRDGEIIKIEDHPDSWVTSEADEVLEINVRGGFVLRCTKNHPVMTNDGWVHAGKLKAGDKVEVLLKWGKFKGCYNGSKLIDSSNVRDYLNYYSNVLMKQGTFVDEPIPFSSFGEDGEELGFSEVESVTKLDGTYRVYDVEYDGKGWFICGGVKVHNSGKSQAVAVISGGLLIILPQLANMPMFADDKRLDMFKRGVKCGIFAPSLRQAQITYGKIKDCIQSKSSLAILYSPEFNLDFTTNNGTTVALTNGSFVTSISASDNSNIEGESFNLIILDESQDISDYKTKKSIHPMGSAYNATIVKIGTATTFTGNFYEAIERNKKEYKEAIEAGKPILRNHFEYDYKVASKYNPMYAKSVEQEKRRLGENSDEFKMAYKLEWVLQRGMLIDIDEFESRNLSPSYDVVSFDHSANHIAGIDVAGGGDDNTVITIREVDWNFPVIMESKIDEETGEERVYMCYNTYLKAWLEIKDIQDYEEQYPIIVDFLNRFHVSRVVIDATRERALADRLNANLPYEVIPYVFTTKSKSELYKHYSKEIIGGRMIVPSGEKTVETVEYQKYMAELGKMQKSWKGTNMVVSHPSGRGEHDDFIDSDALAVWGCSFEGQVNNVETRDKSTLFGKNKSESVFYQSRNKLTARRRR